MWSDGWSLCECLACSPACMLGCPTVPSSPQLCLATHKLAPAVCVM